jgi:hypothetical protein
MQRLAWLADTYLSVASPIQHALPFLLDRAPAFRASLVTRLRDNLRVLEHALSGSAASVLPCEGGWYAVVHLPDLASEEEWAMGLLGHESVIAHPGYFYDFPGRPPHLVVSLLVPTDRFRRGAEAIRRELERRVHG